MNLLKKFRAKDLSTYEGLLSVNRRQQALYLDFGTVEAVKSTPVNQIISLMPHGVNLFRQKLFQNRNHRK